MNWSPLKFSPYSECSLVMIDPVVKYIIVNHSSYIHIYVYDAFRKRGINVKKIITKLHSLYSFDNEDYYGKGLIHASYHMKGKRINYSNAEYTIQQIESEITWLD